MSEARSSNSLGRQVDLAVVAGGGVGVLVQRDARSGDGTARAGELAALAAAQKRADAGDQLAHAEGLGEVVVAADLQAHDLVQLGVAGGKEQHSGAVVFERSRRHSS